jgi:hypothetical protein
MTSRRDFIAALAATVATGIVSAAQPTNVDVYLDPT